MLEIDVKDAKAIPMIIRPNIEPTIAHVFFMLEFLVRTFKKVMYSKSCENEVDLYIGGRRSLNMSDELNWYEKIEEERANDPLSPEFMGKTMYLILRRNRSAVVDMGTIEILVSCFPSSGKHREEYYSGLAKAAGIAFTGETSLMQDLHQAWQIAKVELGHEHEQARRPYSDASYSLRAC